MVEQGSNTLGSTGDKGGPTDTFEVHRQMVIALFVATILVSTFLTIGLLNSTATALVAVVAAGALGGFISALRRLYVFQRVFPVNFFKKWHQVNLYLVIYSLIPSVVGAIAAVTLYLIFAAGLMRGDMFPSFDLSPLNPRADAFENFVWNWQPTAPTDYAKALVWSFVSGFSERFVPDLLTRFSTKDGGESETVTK